ncbi:autotransporter-associated beta strand repeat-containing protein [Luteolibacter arcticus]|uniref:Autotransporter-associated beta strand repeat-containing protein n=1 Tax=Luteolibacter arcticus TaxID=1581411 RepID=A0ABT3GSZ6_9BACT|nr:autotransporter-associated beta strand repeat-containing protein [Luteolibacter arcticus]MCW1926654.1 autotransporter-associated beta strand repeat-containing protein [Luteolibacter arcticus]
MNNQTPYTNQRDVLLRAALRTGISHGQAAFYAVVALSGPLAAQSISVNFGAEQGGEVSEASKTAGAVPVAGNFWNNTTVAAGTLGGLLDSNGATTTGSVSWNSENTYLSASTGATATSENGDLTTGYLDDSGAGWTMDLASPFLLNDIYIIHATDQASPGAISAVRVNGSFYKGDGVGATIPGTASQSWSAASWTNADTLVESTNFIKVLGQPAVSLSGVRGTTSRSALGGVQVVNAYAGTLAYWDANGATAGFGDPIDGTWGTNTFWSASAAGDTATTAWTAGRAAVFSAPAVDTNFTVSVTGTQAADAIWLKQGLQQLNGGVINLSGGLGLVRADGNSQLVIGSQLTGTDVTFAGPVYLLNAANSITGLVTVKSGTTTLEANQSWARIAGGGTIATAGDSVLTVGATNLDSSYAGGISGAFTKAGTGTLTLGANAGAGASFVINGGTVAFDTRVGGNISVARMFTGSGAVLFTGDGTSETSAIVLALPDLSEFSGPITISGARVNPVVGDEFGTSAVSVQAGGQIFATAGTIANNLTLAGLGTTEAAGQLGAVRLQGGAALSGNITLQGAVRVNTWGGAVGSINGPIIGNAASSLEKTGTGTLTIGSTGNSGFLGKTTVDGSAGNGTLQLASDTSLGTAPASPTADAITLLNGGLLQGTGDLVLAANRGITLSSGNGGFNTLTGFTTTVNSPITGAGNLSFTAGPGTTVLNGNVNITGAVNVNAGTTATFAAASVVAGSLIGYSSTTNLSATSATFANMNLGAGTNNAHTVNHSSGIVTSTAQAFIGHWGGNTSVYNISGGSLNLPDNVTDPGAENQANLILGIDGSGILNVSGTGVVNTSSLVVNGRSEGHNTGGANPQPDTVNLTGGRLNLGKWGMITEGTTYAVNLGGGTLGASANWSSSLNMAFTGTNGNTVINTANSVDGTTPHTITLTGTLSGAGGLIKRGAGTLNIGGATKTFTGGVTLEAGTLLLGAGTVSGNLELLGGTFQPGTPTTAGVLQVPNATFGGSGLTFRIGSSVDTINTGNVTVSVPTVITASLLGSLTPGQEFTVIDYSGTMTGFSNLSLAALPNPRYQASLVHDTVNKAVKVRIDAIDSLIWTAAAGTTWDFSAQSWKLSSSSAPTAFLPLDTVLFDGTNPGTITLAGALNATLVTVQTPGNYTFSGSGGLAGNARLVKNGTGSLRLENTNTHAGGNQINGGTVTVATPGALGASGNVTSIAAGGTLDLNGQNLETTPQVIQSAGLLTNGIATRAIVPSFTLTGNAEINSSNEIFIGASAGSAGTFSLGGHTLTKNGTGTLFLNSVSSGNGNIILNGGTLYLIKPYGEGNQRNVALNGTGTVTVNSGASLINARWSSTLDLSKAIVLNGGSLGSAWPGPNGGTIASPISVTADSSLTFGGGYGNVTLSGLITGGSRLTRTGGEQVTFTADNTWTGGLTINSGTVQVGNGGTTGLIGTGSVINNTTLTFNRSNALTIVNAIGGTGAVVKKGTGDTTLTGVNTYTGNTTVETGALVLGAAGKMNFKPAANGISNRITGAGAVDLRGKFTIDLSTADTTTGNSWTLVDRAALAFETFDASFGLDGFTQAADVHTMNSGGFLWTFTESDGVLSVQPGTGGGGYDGWETANGIAGAGANTDSDGDGIVNGIEFVLGTVPSGPNDSASLPKFTVDPTDSAYMLFAFNVTDVSKPYNPRFEYSTTLQAASWSDDLGSGVTQQITEIEEGVLERWTFRVQKSVAAPGGKFFGRIKVDLPVTP